jgi:hypothetical protein
MMAYYSIVNFNSFQSGAALSYELMLQVLIRTFCAVFFLCEVVIIAICLMVVTDDILPIVFTSTISSIATWHLMYTVCQIGLDNGGFLQFNEFAVVGSVVLLSFFGLIMGYENIDLRLYLLHNLLPIIGLPHSVVSWVNWVTCRLVMFVSYGIWIITLYAAFYSSLINLDLMRLAISWFAFYALNLVVSIVTSDQQVVYQLFLCLVNSASSLPAYVGFSAALGFLAMILGFLVHCFVRATIDARAVIVDLALLFRISTYNTVVFGVELYLVNYPLSDTIGIVIFVALAIVLPSWILKNTDSYLTSNFRRRSKFSIFRALLVCLVLFAIPPVVVYKVVLCYGATHWFSITCLPGLLICVSAINLLVKYVVREIDSHVTCCPWLSVEHAVNNVEVSCIH